MVQPTLPPIPVLLPARPYRDRVRSDFFLPYSENETQAFLEDMSDIHDTYMMWDSKSGIYGLLRAVPKSILQSNQTKTDQTQKDRQVEKIIAGLLLIYFLYDFNSGFYRYGYFSPKSLLFTLIPISRVRLGVFRVSKTQEKFMRDLTIRLVNGEINEQQWYNAMRKAMKDQYRSAYLASIGGIDNYTRSEIAKFGWRVRPQYRWLDNFLSEIQSGKQPLNAFAVRRAGMYARAGNGIYQNNIFRIAEQNGKKLAKRILGETDNHCHDTLDRPGCVELAALGYVLMRDAVPIGDAACYSHCLCQWRFR